MIIELKLLNSKRKNIKICKMLLIKQLRHFKKCLIKRMNLFVQKKIKLQECVNKWQTNGILMLKQLLNSENKFLLPVKQL